MAASSVTYTSSDTTNVAEQLINPSYIVAERYEDGDTDDDPTGEAFILESVIRDTTAGSQDDNDTDDIECETSDSPIYTVVKKGAFKISMEIADTQTALLVALCDFVNDSTNNKVYAKAKYTAIYARISIVYELSDGTFTAMVYPKVQLNSKLMLESLNSNLNRIQLAGTAKDITITVNGTTYRVPFYKNTNYSLPTASESE